MGKKRLETRSDRYRMGEILVAYGGAFAPIGRAICAQAGIQSPVLHGGGISANEAGPVLKELGNIGDAIFTVNRNLVVEYWGQRAIEIFGISERDAVGEPITFLETVFAEFEWGKVFDHALAGVAVGPLPAVCRHRNGKSVHVGFVISPVRGTRDRIEKLIVVARDRTEVLAASDSLRAANASLEALTMATSHGLRAPLVSVLGLLNVALEELEEGNEINVKRAILRAQCSAQEMLPKLERLNRFNELDTEAIRPVPLKSVVERALGQLEIPAVPDGPRITIENGHHATSQAATLERVLVILLQNAAQHGCDPNNPEVLIAGKKTGQGIIEVLVRDNGGRFSELASVSAFQPKQRFLKDGAGAGLGLVLAKQAMLKIGGEIEVDCEAGKHTSFLLRLRAYPPEKLERGKGRVFGGRNDKDE